MKSNTQVRRARKAGFTMAELIMAIGIMAMGMVLAAALFPAAIKECNSSYDSTMGQIVCENGLSVVKTMVTIPESATTWPGTGSPLTTLTPIAAENVTTIIPLVNQHYGGKFDGGVMRGLADADIAATDKMRGFAVLGKKIGDNYLIAILSYNRARNTSGTPAMRLAPISIDTASNAANNVDKITINGNSANLRYNTPVVFGNGAHAMITAVSGNTATLDRKITVDTANRDGYLLIQAGSSAGDESPGMGVLVTRTGLSN